MLRSDHSPARSLLWTILGSAATASAIWLAAGAFQTSTTLAQTSEKDNVYAKLLKELRDQADSEAVVLSFTPASTTYVKPYQKAYGGRLKIVDLLASTGDVVKKDAPFVRFEAIDHESAVKKAREAIKDAEAKLKRAEDELEAVRAERTRDVEREQMDLEDAKYKLADWEKEGRDRYKANAEQRVQNVRNSLDNQLDELRQLERLYKGNELATESQEIVLKRARRGIESTRLRLKNAEQTLKETLDRSLPREDWKRKTAVADAERAMARAQRRQSDDIEKNEKSYESAKSSLEKARRHLQRVVDEADKLEVLVPRDGIIVLGQMGKVDGLNEPIRKGSNAKVGQILATIAATDRWTSEFDLPIALRAFVSGASSVKIKLSSGDIIDANVEGVGALVNDGHVRARVSVSGVSAEKLLLGMSGELIIR